MYEKLTVRIPREDYQTFKEVAESMGLSMAELVRRFLATFSVEKQLTQTGLGKENLNNSEIQIQKNFRNFSTANELNSTFQKSLMVETVLLLRELILQRDSQILRKVDSEMDQLFGPEREKIYGTGLKTQ